MEINAMNIFRRFFNRLLSRSQAHLVPRDCEPQIAGLSITHNGLDSEPLRLLVYQANGGTIVETRTYDRQKDKSKNSLYIIRDDQNLGEEISKIITYTHLGV